MLHHFVDVFVRGRDLVKQDFRVPILNARKASCTTHREPPLD